MEIEWHYKTISFVLALESRAARQDRFPWEETVKQSINIQLVRNGLVILVDCSKLGVRMDHIVPASTTYPVTQVGYITMLAMYKKN